MPTNGNDVVLRMNTKAWMSCWASVDANPSFGTSLNYPNIASPDNVVTATALASDPCSSLYIRYSNTQALALRVVIAGLATIGGRNSALRVKGLGTKPTPCPAKRNALIVRRSFRTQVRWRK